MKLPSNDPALKSWVEVPVDSDFSIQNLPFGIFRTPYLEPVAGVAIGNHVLDLVCLHEHGFLDGLGLPAGLFNQRQLNPFFALGRMKVREVRERVSELLRSDNDELKGNTAARELALIPAEEAIMQLPLDIRNYTDFYSSEEHATRVGSMFRDPKNALLPNWKHIPIAYHGRASSIVVSGTPVVRPNGQTKAPDQDRPTFGPSRKLDFELELAFVTGTASTLGKPISIQDAESHIIGLVLFNDWSARDIQTWEYVPLGPFLAKNFASTISPWIVTLDALEPFRVAGPQQDPPVLPYLKMDGPANFDINLEVFLQAGASKPQTIARTNFRYMYWNMAQQLAHHTVNGCNILPGDLYASGTISGPDPGSCGSLLELTWNGRDPIPMADGSNRTFLLDGDTVIMRGWAARDGVRVGFGNCEGQIVKG